MKRSFIACALLIAVCILKTNSAYSQSDTIRHQIGIGVWPGNDEYPYLNMDFRTYFKKKAFYNFSIGGFYQNYGDGDYQLDLTTSASVGLYFNFFKICRFNMAAQFTVFFARQRSINQNSTGLYEADRNREGVFIGPEFSLEIRALRFKASEIAIFSKIYSSIGIMHERITNDSPLYQYSSDETYKEGFGFIAVGLSYRF